MRTLCYVMLFLFVAIAWLAPDNAKASYCNDETVVFFGNGMFNLQDKAEASAKKLKRMLIEEGGLNEDNWAFEVSYNHHEGAVSLLEVFRQRMGDQASSYWRWLGNLDIAPEWFQEKAQSIASSIEHAEVVIDDDLKKHINRYKGLLMEGNRVLVVAHSQGNFYANAAHANLATDGTVPMDAFGIVAVATPASKVENGGPYFTLTNDHVINGVRALFSTTLDGNVTNSNEDPDWKHHSFVDSYLNGDNSGPLIVNSVLNEALGLAWPEAQLGKGPISVTLTWGEQPDMDLHIFEPNWSHVYYADPVGISGYLDRDDSSQKGPEHYYVDCTEALETGLYKVAVNYYRGTGMETAQIQIQAGDVLRDYTVPMYLAMGSTGNTRPWRVATIDVTEKPEGGYAFKVDGR